MFAVASSSKNRFPWKPGSIQVSVQPNNLREYFSACNFLQVMVLLKNAVCSNGICWNGKKKFLFLEEGSPEKKSYASAMVVVLTDKLTL